jgi:hypothetical protein
MTYPLGIVSYNADSPVVIFEVSDLGSPVVGAEVEINGETVLTESDGTATFLTLQLGQTYAFSVTKSGYVTYTDSVLVNTLFIDVPVELELVNPSLTLVVYEPTQVALENATVTIDGSSYLTDVIGAVVLDDLVPGQSYPFTITHPDMVPCSGTVIMPDIESTFHIEMISDYAIGDPGPADGLITYINPTAEIDGWKWIETAPSANPDEAVPYSNVSILIGTTGVGIGSGAANTTAIINQQGAVYGAAAECAAYVRNTYDDWFLPSNDELNLLYVNLHPGDFVLSSYWSSSEYSATSAYRQSFGTGVVSSGGKNSFYRYRPIRTFSVVEYYPITYSGNNQSSGTVPSTNWYYAKGSAAVSALDGSDLVRGTDMFICWNTSPDGFGTDYYVGDPVPIPASPGFVLYAKYESEMLVFLPDTQSYSKWRPEDMELQTDWIVSNAVTNDIKFVGHVGDVIQDYDNVTQWTFMQGQMAEIGAVVPYNVLPGNHDYVEGTRDSSYLNTYFPLSTFSAMSSFGGSYDTSSDNTYHIVNVHGTDWLVFSLEMGPRTAVLDWANGIIALHPTKPVILITHAYLKGQEPGTGDLLVHLDNHAASNGYGLGAAPPLVNDGIDIWNHLVYPNDNIRFVICGHDGTPDIGSAYRVSQNHLGLNVYQIMSNFQYWASYPAYMVLLKFDSTGTVLFRTYSPKFSSFKTDIHSQDDCDLT